MRMRDQLGVLLSAAILGAVLFSDPASSAEPRYKRSVQPYAMPDVTLVNQDGARVKLKTLLASGKPVALDFIYGTCTTICPVLSAGFASVQQRLAPDTQRVLLISITIDPEHDTPRVMKEYLKQYRAKPGWDFLTGTREDIDKVMRAFDSYVPDKMSHRQLTFLLAPGADTWVRTDGLMRSSELMAELAKAGLL